MARKDSIAGSSLELLLDTMCNTFGGVMFIAIALVIISTFIPKVVDDLEGESRSDKTITTLQQSIDILQKKLKEQQQSISLKDTLVKKFKNSEHVEELRKLGDLKDKNQQMRLLTDEEKTIEINLMIALRQKKEVETRIEIMLKKKEQKLRDLNDDITLINAKIEKLKRQLAKLADQPPPEQRTIGLAPLIKTDKTPFIVLLDSNKLYSVNIPGSDLLFDGKEFTSSKDVKIEPLMSKGSPLPSAALIHPVPGRGVYINPDAASIEKLKKFFSKVDKRKHFISFEVNKNSFDSFIKVKRFLQKQGFSLYWFPADKYMLSFGKTEYKAR